MARQRFIWPSIWTDPQFGRLQPLEQVMFIGLFSIADDDGRLMGSPEYLRGELYRYKDMSTRKVRSIRDAVLTACPNVHFYVVNDVEYIQLTKWSEYQHPKYPKPSKLPPPPPQDSPKASGILEEDSPNVSPQGWDGLGRDVKPSAVELDHTQGATSANSTRINTNGNGPCPECETGGGLHALGCSRAGGSVVRIRDRGAA